MIKEVTEDEYNNLEKGKVTGIFYCKSDYPRWYCVVFKEGEEPFRNVWNVEKHAFEWMNKFTKYFQKC